jgi:hypothetical protein
MGAVSVIAVSWPQVDFTGPAIDFHRYGGWQVFWYIGGFVLWAPAYVMVIVIAKRERRLEIPAIAAIGNVTWEFMWGFLYRVDMGWALQLVYQGAFVLDCFILWNVFRYGALQTSNERVRAAFPWLAGALIAGWAAFYAGMRGGGYDLPLGSVSAYTLNVAESAVYLWAGIAAVDVWCQSLTVAWSKGIGTGMVSVFVFLRYDGNDFIQMLAVLVAVLDVVYFAVLLSRRRNEPRVRTA